MNSDNFTLFKVVRWWHFTSVCLFTLSFYFRTLFTLNMQFSFPYTLFGFVSAPQFLFTPLRFLSASVPPPPVYDTLSPLPPPEVLKHAEGKFSHFQSLYFFLRTLMKWQQHLPACVLVFMRLHWCTKKCVCVCVACVCVYVSACTSAGEWAWFCCINLVKWTLLRMKLPVLLLSFIKKNKKCRHKGKHMHAHTHTRTHTHTHTHTDTHK